jgi:multidrug resistance efflux pump
MRLSARINGQVEQLDVLEGQLVHAGDVLAVIDQKEYGIALSQTLANLAYADDIAACAHFNAAISMISAYGVLDLLQAAVQNAEVELAAAKHKLRADKAALEQAQANAIYRLPDGAMTNDWKWVLRSSPAMRPITR